MFKWAKVVSELIGLGTIDLSLGLSILMSFKKLLTFTELDIAEILKRKFIFAISLLCATIQDSGMKEKSSLHNLLYISFII